jgi:hypothetical protein
MRFAWTFEREARWMVYLLLAPLVLILLSIGFGALRRAFGW